MGDDMSVKVGVRIRPQIPRELIEMCHVCTRVVPGEPQVILGKDKSFTFDNVFDMNTPQEDVYDLCISPLIEGCFDGYNATVLAYGQTGSGKTYTMGTGFDINQGELERGIIPRAVEHLFRGISERQRVAKEAGESVPEFKVNAQFMELYNEEINDLLNPAGDLDDKGKRMHIKIHEDSQGGIYTLGVTTRSVSSIEETLQCLKVGALSRTTGSTQMNTQSSRSHAIFTLHIKQQRIVKVESSEKELDEIDSGNPTESEGEGLSEFETLTAKFHFVDLAGSERLKRTGATGERAKEGISINCGLLALGNVISALGDKSRRVSHVPYRDSKLTRLLQDSLGGNSRTLMIACVSPSDRDFMETLNTLKYANRAKNIKNKVMVNQDKSSQTITTLRKEIQRLELELMEYKQGKRILGEDGCEQINDMFHENTMLQTENNNLRTRIKALQETVDRLNNKNTSLLLERETHAWITSGDGSKSDISEMIQGYIKEIEELRAKLLESEETCTLLRRQVCQRAQNRVVLTPTSVGSAAIAISGTYDIPIEAESHSVYELLQDAKKDVRRLKKKTKKLKESGKEADDEEEQDKDESESKGDGDEEELNGVEDLEEDSSDSETEDKVALFREGALEDPISGEHYSEDLAELTCEISIKERLILELEQSQRRLLTMRQHYENKLAQLQIKIRETESERDRVLGNMGSSVSNQSDEKVKKVKETFEKKLNTLQNDLRKLQAAKREHAQLMKTQSNYERQLRQLKDEVSEMKKTKVRLVTKMKEESQRHREEVKRRNKEMDQMRKESRRKETQLRKMEAEKRMKENILRRKTEEVNALRRLAKPMSDKVAGRVPLSRRNVPPPSSISSTPLSTTTAGVRRGYFSPKISKQKWQNLEKNINKLVLNKQCIYNVERDMDRWLHEREKLSRCLEKITRKRDRAILDGKETSVLQDLEEQMENLRANIDYIHENIAECQSSIGQMEDAKDDLDSVDVNVLLGSVHLEECKYLLQKLITMAINQSFQVAQQGTSVKELEAKLQQVLSSNSVQQQLLQHLLNQANEDLYSYAVANANQDEYESANSSRSTSPIDCMSQADAVSMTSTAASYTLTTPQPSGTLGRRDKARRKTATPDELLYHQRNMSGAGEASASHSNISPLPEMSEAMMSASYPLEALEKMLMTGPTPTQTQPNLMTQSMSGQAAAAALLQDSSFHRVTSAPGSLREMAVKPKSECSPVFGRKVYGELSPAMRRKNYVPNPPSLASRQNSVETTASDLSPPNSPTSFRRADNVFSRLTSGMKKTNKPDRGIISAFVGKSQPATRSTPLVCSHIAEGHSKAVLSITATDDVLFSSSKDRTVKIWDLHTGQEIQSLGGHPNNVSTVQYCEYTRLAFSVSAAYVRVWDVRENPAKCVKTLSSSGITTNGALLMATPSRTSHMPPGESQINDIALNHYGTTLYSAAGNIVRIWDLRMFTNLGRLSGGHQAAVMCLAVDDIGMDNNLVVTGSKDHYIKVFEVLDGVGGIQTPKMNLEPPHYDGIQCLAISGDFLFSGSRDMCIKKWDLASNYLVQSLNQAHKDWICALSFLPSGNVLLSGCRGGFLKLWSSDTCQQLAEIKAHNAPINSISTNSSAVFTASNDSTISIWLLRSSHDASPEFSDFGDERF